MTEPDAPVHSDSDLRRVAQVRAALAERGWASIAEAVRGNGWPGARAQAVQRAVRDGIDPNTTPERLARELRILGIYDACRGGSA